MRRQTELPDVFRMYVSGNHEVYAVVNGMLNLMSCDEKSCNLLYESWRTEADTETLEQAKQIPASTIAEQQGLSFTVAALAVVNLLSL